MLNAGNTASTMRSESVPLMDNTSTPQQGSVRYTALVGSLVVLYIGLSSTLINFNKYLVADHIFPFPIALAWLHMGTSFLFSYSMYFAFGKSWFTSIDLVRRRPHHYFGKILPIAICFGGSVVLSNQAYMYCSVPFLQMCRECNIILVYMIALYMGLEGWNGRTVAVLMLTLLGATMGIEGELNFSKAGLAIQFVSQLLEVWRLVIQQVLVQNLSVDPLTLILIVAPLSTLAVSTTLYFFWTPEILTQGALFWPQLLLNCLNSFILNLVVGFLIKVSSGVSFVIAGVLRDIVVVLTAVVVFHAGITRTQSVGFGVALLGVALHSLQRIAPADERSGFIGMCHHIMWGKMEETQDLLEKGDSKRRRF